MLPPQPPVTVCQRPGSRKRAAFARCRQEDHQDGDEDDEAGQEDHQGGDEDDEAGQEVTKVETRMMVRLWLMMGT